MKENKLSVWSFPYRTSHYLTHPWKWFKDLYWNIRNFWHRGRYGFAYVDVWNFCDWYPRAGAAALRYLAEHGNAFPGTEPWDTPERWNNFLIELARKLDRCADSMDICFTDEENEYSEAFHEAFTKLTRHEKENEDGSVTTWHDETPEFNALRDKYFARERELSQKNEDFCEETFATVGQTLGHLWD